MRGPIVVLGGYGETGRRLANLLSSRGMPVLIAGRDGSKAASLAERLGATSRAEVTSAAVDASDRRALAGLLGDASLVVNATSATAPIRTVVGASLDVGVDVVDLQLVPRGAELLRSLAGEVEAAGRCVIAQAGFHPGVPAALARWAAGYMEDVDRVWTAGLLRARGGIPYTPAVDDLIELFRGYRAHVVEDGVVRPVRFSRPEAYPRVGFAYGFGRQWTAVWDLDEIVALPQVLPGVRRAGFSIAGFDPVTDAAVSTVIMLALPLCGPRGVSRLGRLLCWSTRTFSHPPFGCVVQAVVEGRRDGSPAAIRVALFHEDGYDLTAIPAVSMIEQVLDGTARRPGVQLMGLAVDPDRLLTDVQLMGVRIVRQALGRRPCEPVQPPITA